MKQTPGRHGDVTEETHQKEPRFYLYTRVRRSMSIHVFLHLSSAAHEEDHSSKDLTSGACSSKQVLLKKKKFSLK